MVYFYNDHILSPTTITMGSTGLRLSVQPLMPDCTNSRTGHYQLRDPPQVTSLLCALVPLTCPMGTTIIELL